MNTWNRFLQACLGVLLCFAVVQTAYGQTGRVTRYVPSTFSATFTSIIGGSGTNSVSVTSVDDGYATFSSPFAFNYDSTNFSLGTTIGVNSNCMLTMNGFISSGCCSNNVGSSAYPNTMCFYSADMYMNSGSAVYYQVSGSAPSRVLTIEWPAESPCCGSTNNCSMQVKLYESTNVIEYWYATNSKAIGSSAGCGLNGGTTYGFLYQQLYTSMSSTPANQVRWTPPQPPLPPSQLSLSPHSINFGGVSAGSPVTATFTAYSVGPANLHINGYAISGAPDYTMVTFPKAGDSIVSGGSATYTVRFNPITSGARNATFSLFTDGRDSGTQNVALSGLGLAPSVSYGTNNLFHKISRRLGDSSAVQYIPITSTGTGPLSINSIYFIGLNPDNYSVSRMPANPLAVGKTDSIGIRFTPKLEGRPDAAVVINTNAFNIPWDTVALFGVGRLARLVVAAAGGNSGGYGASINLRFDSVALGDSVCQSLSLHNTGSDTLKILRQVVTSSDYDFSYYPLTGSDTMLVPDQTKLVNLCFKPIKAGARLASIRYFTNIPMTYESTPRDTSQFNVNVSGVGVPFGRLDVQGRFTDSVLVATKDCITATLHNSGQTDLTINSATLSGTYNSEYTLTWTGGAPSFVLTPGSSKTVQICFTPGDRGPRPAMLKLVGSTSGQPIVDSLAIAGYGLHMCGTPTPAALYDTVMLGARDSKTIAVQNCGEVTTIDSASFSATTSQSFAFGSGISATVLPGNSGNFTVMFSPTALGAANGMLNFTPSPAIPPVPLYGYGIGVITKGANTPASAKKGDCVNDTINFPNNGNISWNPGTPTLGGPDAADFTIVSSTTGATAAGGTVQVILKFCPSKVGAEMVTIDFPSSSPEPYLWTTDTINANGLQAGAVAERSEQNGFVLGQCYPNPTNASAQVALSLPIDASVRMDIIDATGAVVRNAFSGRLSTGDHTLSIDAKGLASGTYYYVVTSGDVRLTRQMVLVK